jgi:hypothetical protein
MAFPFAAHSNEKKGSNQNKKKGPGLRIARNCQEATQIGDAKTWSLLFFLLTPSVTPPIDFERAF